ncbi:DUF4349 domain-containing protein [Methanoregula formicica]|uniref:DUF4349 domain-containing protein n=1 Tax=Methanoregula formicica (strain DSM 22288 / NBRC 105244 / SMSP) TaxID=593750 RepID=L0HFZ1_METFS|nr:DUF4349 domain-containing protein [Methanoregula formicica]AGB02223.1 hypothetical protein Metfor_1179 [Methanoregula formicica SMSP]
MNQKVIVLLIFCIAVAAAAGCTGLPASTSGYTSSSQDVVRSEAIYDNGWSGTPQKISGTVAVAPMPASASEYYGADSATVKTKIIKTADITVEVRDVTGAAESLKSLATSHGGYLSSTNIRKNYQNQLSGTVTIRVPQASFDAAIEGVKALGTLKSISTSGEDVTEQYVDLEARKASYTNQLAQYNAIMKQSTRVEDIIKVQEQIDRVQTELDRLNGRLNYLNSRIDLATITVYLQEPEPVGGQAGHDFVSAINEGIAGFLGMIDALIILLFTLLPLIIIGAIGYGIYTWQRNKKGPAARTPEEKK